MTSQPGPDSTARARARARAAEERPPLVAALLLFALVAGWATGLMTGLTSLPSDVGVSAGAAVWLVGIIALVGLLVARGRWAQRLGVGLVVLSVVPSAFTEGSWFCVLVLLAATAGAALLREPTTSWIRPGRSLEAPPDEAVLLMLMLVAWPLVGAPLAGNPFGLLVWIGPLLAFWYSRAVIHGLWAVRIGGLIPAVAAIGGDWPGWLLGLGLSAASLWLAWKAEVRLAVLPLTSRPSAGVCPTPDFDALLRGLSDDG